MTPITSKFTAGCLAILALSTWFTVGCSMGFHAEKGTGPVTVQMRRHGSTYQLLRPNAELFVMDLKRESGICVSEGDSFSNIVYYDDGNMRVFIKAEGFKPHPESEKLVKPTAQTDQTNGVWYFSDEGC